MFKYVYVAMIDETAVGHRYVIGVYYSFDRASNELARYIARQCVRGVNTSICPVIYRFEPNSNDTGEVWYGLDVFSDDVSDR